MEFSTREFPMPRMSFKDAASQAVRDLIRSLENMAPDAPYNTIGIEQNAALRHLAKIFCIVQPRSITVPNMKVIQYAPPPRVNNNNVAPPRVTTTTTLSAIAPMNQEPPLNGCTQQTLS